MSLTATRSHGVHRRALPLVCSTPECDSTPVIGGRFCEPCKTRLGGWRQELDDLQRKKGPKGRSECSAVGCRERRQVGSVFCEAHSGEEDS